MIILNTRNKLILAGMLVVGVVAFSQKNSFGKKEEEAVGHPPPVTVTVSQVRDLPVKFAGQGRLVALNQVDVRPQLTGLIRSVDFHEGEPVRAGQLLFTLDATDVNAQLRRTEAQAAQVQAQLDDARRDYARSKELFAQKFIASSVVATAGSKVETLQAQMKAAAADIDSARVQLAHARITSPIDALAGALTVHPGSLAQLAASAPLVTLTVIDPIGVELNLPEQDLAQLLAARAAGPVAVVLDGPNGQAVTGKLTFINPSVNIDTGTITLKASFPNPDKRLWPGSFSKVTVMAGTDHGSVVLPPQAVLEGPGGGFVYVLGKDSRVEQKSVTVLRVQDRMAVVSGVEGGVSVIVEGNQNLRPGALVRVAQAAAGAAGRTQP